MVLFVAQRLVRQWMHDMRQFLVAFGRAHGFLREDGTSDPDVDSVLLCVSRFGEVCTVDASVTWKSGHYFHNPLASCSRLVAVRAFPQKSFLELSMTQSCELSRARGVAGSPGVLTPRCQSQD